ncbi:MAG: DNA primase [Clostridia bacterium]|nr:DNA primase [Clostridia bacterium]
MPGFFSQDFIDDLRNRVNIVDFIREYLVLKKQGQNYIGLCPFHAEKTPSFVVSPHKQIYHCFGCGKGGNVYSFLMEKDGLSFPEAVVQLANRCGVPIPQDELSPDKLRQNSLRERYYHINELSANFFQKMLYEPKGKRALQYLQNRGLAEQTCKLFQLGFAPDSWDQLCSFLLQNKVTEKELITLGLAVKSQKGTLVDRFRNRLMFPITNASGKIIGFGGRVLDDTQPKYLNSPETPLFSKGKHLYGLNLARGSIRNKEQAILMEGYMDVITAHQHGVTQAVGTLGTALTEEQCKLLMRYTYNVVTCFDADTAGQKATKRGLDLLQQLGLKVAVMTIPEGEDPDEFLKNQGYEEFQKALLQAYPVFEYNLLKLMEKYNRDDISGKIQIIQELVPDLYRVQSPVKRQGYIQMLAERLSFSEQAIYAEIRKFQTGQSFNNREQSTKNTVQRKKDTVTAADTAQRVLIRLVLETPEILLEVEKAGGKELFSNDLYQEIYQTNYLLSQAGHNIKVEDLVTHLENEEARQVLTEILLSDELLKEGKRIYQDCLTTLEIELLNRKIEEKNILMTQSEKNGDVTKSLKIMAEVQVLIKERQSLLSTLKKGGGNLEG